MNRILAIISILLLLFNLLGYAAIFQIEKSHIQHAWKQKLKKGVPKEELYHFQFSEEEWKSLNWTKPNKEFKINDHFYDVVYRNFSDGKHFIQAVSDDQETVLFQNLAKLVRQSWNDTPMSQSPSKLFDSKVSDQYLPIKTLPLKYASSMHVHCTKWLTPYSILKLNKVWNPPQVSLIG